MSGFDVGDLVILVRDCNPQHQEYLGRCFTVGSPLTQRWSGARHRIDPSVAAFTETWAEPVQLLKITPPPEMRSEDTDEPIEVIVR